MLTSLDPSWVPGQRRLILVQRRLTIPAFHQWFQATNPFGIRRRSTQFLHYGGLGTIFGAIIMTQGVQKDYIWYSMVISV